MALASRLVLSMHDIPLALAQTDRIVVLDEGRLVLDAPARELSAADLAPFFGA